jgi:hypothetical protein
MFLAWTGLSRHGTPARPTYINAGQMAAFDRASAGYCSRGGNVAELRPGINAGAVKGCTMQRFCRKGLAEMSEYCV